MTLSEEQLATIRQRQRSHARYGPDEAYQLLYRDIPALLDHAAAQQQTLARLETALRAISNAKDVPLSLLLTETGELISAHYQRIADAALNSKVE